MIHGTEHGSRVGSFSQFLSTAGAGLMPLSRPGLGYFWNPTKLKLSSQLRGLEICKC